MKLVFNKLSCVVLAVLFLPGIALAEEAAHKPLDLTASGVGIAAIIIFLLAYLCAYVDQLLGAINIRPLTRLKSI
jgi:hypothetical protein